MVTGIIIACVLFIALYFLLKEDKSFASEKWIIYYNRKEKTLHEEKASTFKGEDDYFVIDIPYTPQLQEFVNWLNLNKIKIKNENHAFLIYNQFKNYKYGEYE